MSIDINILKHYLGTGVKLIHYKSGKIHTLTGCAYHDNDILFFTKEAPTYLRLSVYPSLKLLLRPMSDLTKEIEHNGERFVPADELYKKEYSDKFDYGLKFLSDEYSCEIRYEFISRNSWRTIKIKNNFNIIQQLCQWHFNCFNLDPSLWIDINTLE